MKNTEHCSVIVNITNWKFQCDSDHEKHWTLQCDSEHNEGKNSKWQ